MQPPEVDNTPPLSKLGNAIPAHPIATISVVIFLIIFGILAYISSKTIFHQNPYGEGMNISGLSSVQNLPEDEQDHITAELLKTVKGNLPEGVELPKDGAKLRSGSISYYNNMSNLASSFIVDIESARQSYVITVEWQKKADVAKSSGYPVTVTCLTDTEKIIYPEFKCKDFVTEAVGSDLILIRYLPKRAGDYALFATDPSAEKPKITATIFIHSYETAYADKDKKAEQVKSQIAEFVQSVGGKMEDYVFEYKIEYGD